MIEFTLTVSSSIVVFFVLSHTCHRWAAVEFLHRFLNRLSFYIHSQKSANVRSLKSVAVLGEQILLQHAQEVSFSLPDVRRTSSPHALLHVSMI